MKGIWYWMYFSGSFKELWAWTFIHAGSGFIWPGKSGKKVPVTEGVMESQGTWKFLLKSQGKSGKKIPVENEVSRSTFGFQNCFYKKIFWVCLF